MGHPLFRRKKKLIRPAFQLRIAITIVVSLITYSVILGLLIFYPLWLELESAVSIYEKERISLAILSLHRVIWPAVVVVAVLVGVQVVLASHRIAGPVYRLDQTLRELIRGNFSVRMNLRKKDEFRELEDLVNELSEYLQSVRDRDRRLHAEVAKEMEDIVASVRKGGNHEAADQLAELAERLKGVDSFAKIPSKE